MIFFVILGVLIGVASFLFVLQNIAPVTVSFLSYHLNGSLAVVLFFAILAGMLMSVLILFPSFIRDEFRISKLKKQIKLLEDELAAAKISLQEHVHTTVVETHTTEPTTLI